MYTGYLQSPLGNVEINASNKGLVSVTILEETADIPGQSEDNPLVAEAKRQLTEYFAKQRKQFDLPLDFEGTGFQHKVWEELLKIPYGTTISYLQLAIRLGSKLSVRAVGTANGRNPLWIIIPCHRVVGNNGDLTGYAGGLWRKQWLLEHEGSINKLAI
ncbi:MAG: methylated-DNA--[protein]-cysteine S-methyltransferase [Bacteroidota bacterium]|nr:methylated-DNA--[protein]-cysteine S-methyltransferase [Bacteroidota bacterium]